MLSMKSEPVEVEVLCVSLNTSILLVQERLLVPKLEWMRLKLDPVVFIDLNCHVCVYCFFLPK